MRYEGGVFVVCVCERLVVWVGCFCFTRLYYSIGCKTGGVRVSCLVDDGVDCLFKRCDL